MVARINFSTSLRNVLNYNENKLKQEIEIRLADGSIEKKKMAEFFHAANYGKDTERLGFTDRFKRLEKQAALNDRSKKSIVHISLNFDPSEKLQQEKLKEIADAYMQKIGFGDQPYLVYQHFDAGHPHIHIVSTTIQNDGSRIKTHNIGRNQSEQARKDVESLFGLVRAESHKPMEAYQLASVNALKVQYGKSVTKRAITNVLDAVLTTYKYTSLAELNAVLKQYNVVADRGTENSRMYKSNGLVYRVLDESGNKIGTPIKASAFYNKPGLKFLEEKFKQNESLRQPYKQRVKNAIDLAFAKRPVKTIDELIKVLQKEKIQLVLRQNDKGIIYGITYIDYDKKCVFNGSDLGKQYSANAIQQRLTGVQELKKEKVQLQQHDEKMHKQDKILQKEKDNNPITVHPSPPKQTGDQFAASPSFEIPQHDKGVLQELLQPENNNDSIPYELKKQKRKRQRKKLHL
jgi:hypothetical protein